MSFDVACSAEHAFGVWTSRIGTWWPRDHTVTGHPEQVVLQGDVSGRTYQRTADGAQNDWGEVPESLLPHFRAAAEKSAMEKRDT
jgi:hypothetical protein